MSKPPFFVTYCDKMPGCFMCPKIRECWVLNELLLNSVSRRCKPVRSGTSPKKLAYQKIFQSFVIFHACRQDDHSVEALRFPIKKIFVISADQRNHAARYFTLHITIWPGIDFDHFTTGAARVFCPAAKRIFGRPDTHADNLKHAICALRLGFLIGKA